MSRTQKDSNQIKNTVLEVVKKNAKAISEIEIRPPQSNPSRPK